jgi:NAD(P)-dependent dehydrogenase (short-subunit alcohol dehydrogenase family)
MAMTGQVSYDFSDKIVLITGGSTGIGRATALAFGRAGAAVVLASRDAEDGDEVARLIEKEGGRAVHQVTDVSDDEQVAALVRTTVDTFGGLDIAFNNAGTLPPTGALADQTLQDWDRTIAVDLTGVFYSLRHEIPAMIRGGGGAVINTASVAGVIADPGMSPYVAAKHGVIGLTKAAAMDYARDGIRVNAIAPGLVRTPMIEGWLADPEMRETVLDFSPQHRVSEPEEIAGVVLYLASDSASFITGSVTTIDGGQTAH